MVRLQAMLVQRRPLASMAVRWWTLSPSVVRNVDDVDAHLSTTTASVVEQDLTDRFNGDRGRCRRSHRSHQRGVWPTQQGGVVVWLTMTLTLLPPGILAGSGTGASGSQGGDQAGGDPVGGPGGLGGGESGGGARTAGRVRVGGLDLVSIAGRVLDGVECRCRVVFRLLRRPQRVPSWRSGRVGRRRRSIKKKAS